MKLLLQFYYSRTKKHFCCFKFRKLVFWLIGRSTLYNSLKLILLVMFIGHYSNITMFSHTHLIDGVTYCHSHFYWYGKSSIPVQLPQHTKEQLKLIQEYNHISFTSDIEIPRVEKPIYSVIAEFLTPSVTSTALARVLFFSLRAPPSFLV